MPKTLPFKIGADPEFNLLLQGRRLNAQDTFIQLCKDRLTRDNRTGGFTVGEVGNFGWDGCNATGELRPKPADTPQGLVANLQGLYAKMAEVAQFCDVSTLNFHAPIGGHVHFDLPANTTSSAVRVIHHKLSSFFLPVLMGENHVSLQLRAQTGYGKLVDFHADNHFKRPDGTDVHTYEFRTPSAEWTTTPKIAVSVLAYLSVVYNEILNKPKNFAKFKDLIYKTDKQGNALQELALSDYKTLTLMLFKSIHKAVKTFELYPDYKKEIEYVFDPGQVLADKRAVGFNVFQGWGLRNLAKPTRRMVLSDKATTSKITEKKIDLDTQREFAIIPFNDDRNVKAFATALQTRVLAYDWRLKNQYFLFGLKKGVEKYMIRDKAGNFYAGSELINTTKDLDYANDLFTRMNIHYNDSTRGLNQSEMDYESGKLKHVGRNVVMIGIPYEDRAEGAKTKGLLALVHGIETDKIKPKKVEVATLTAEHKTEGGALGLAEVLSKETSTESPYVVDEGSQGQRMAVVALRELNENADREITIPDEDAPAQTPDAARPLNASEETRIRELLTYLHIQQFTSGLNLSGVRSLAIIFETLTQDPETIELVWDESLNDHVRTGLQRAPISGFDDDTVLVNWNRTSTWHVRGHREDDYAVKYIVYKGNWFSIRDQRPLLPGEIPVLPVAFKAHGDALPGWTNIFIRPGESVHLGWDDNPTLTHLNPPPTCAAS